MQKFTPVESVVAPLDRANVDTDAIIPKQYLKSIKRTGFGPSLFDEWRYLDYGEPGMDHSTRQKNPDFVLNKPAYENTQVLLARENFGCGSSREHAVWALEDFGLRVVIAPSFADIFFNNAFKSGLLPIKLDEAIVDRLFEVCATNEGTTVRVDLISQTITVSTDEVIDFDVDSFRKHCLLEGLDDIGLTLQHADSIKAYEEQRRQRAPWIFS